MNKTLKIVSIIILLIAIGVTGWFLVAKKSQNGTNLVQENVEVKNENQQQEKQANNNQKSVEEKTEDIDTSNWKTYRNEELGFEVKYPEECTVSDNKNVLLDKIVGIDCHNEEAIFNGHIPDTAKFIGSMDLIYDNEFNKEQYIRKQKENCIKNFGNDKQEVIEKIQIVNISNREVVKGGGVMLYQTP